MTNPSPETIRAARHSVGLSQGKAAALVYSRWAAWQRWESGARKMHPALWELFRIKVGLL